MSVASWHGKHWGDPLAAVALTLLFLFSLLAPLAYPLPTTTLTSNSPASAPSQPSQGKASPELNLLSHPTSRYPSQVTPTATPPAPLSTGVHGEASGGASGTGAPLSASNPFYMQEGATFAQFDQGQWIGFGGWYINVTLKTSPYPIGYEFNGVTNMGDWYQVLVGYNWPGCNRGYEMLYAGWNNTGSNSDGTFCDPSVTLTTGDSVALELYIDNTSSDSTYQEACMYVFDWTTNLGDTNNDCFPQANGGSAPQDNYFVPLMAPSNSNGYATGPWTELIDVTSSSCTTYSGLPTMVYQFPQTNSMYVTHYIPWSDQFQPSTATTCYQDNSTPIIALTKGDHSTHYSQEAPSYGPHWESGQNASTGTAGNWIFETDNTPSSPATVTVSESQSTADIGQSVTYGASVSGGTSPYTCHWYLNNVFQASTSSCASWSWTPSATGTDAVAATVTDNSGSTYEDSNTVSITVSSDPIVSSPTASPASGGIDQGQTVTFTSATPSGGLAPYTYTWTTLPSWCANSNALTMTCTPSGSGNFSVGVTVTDTNKYAVASPILNYTVNGPVTAKLTGGPTVLDVGQSINLTTTASGGSGTYTYAYAGLPSGCSSTRSTVSCSLSSKGSFSISATVVDSTGFSVTTNTVNLTVNSAPTITSSLTVTPSSITLGASISLSVVAAGGTGSLTYAYSGLPGGCTPQNSSSFSCTPIATGTSTVTVVITDFVGKSVSSSASVTVKPKNPPSISSFVANPGTITVGQSTTFTVVATGGTPPLAYVYTGLPGGCSSFNQSTLGCTPSQTGSFHVSVTVTDFSGLSASSSTTLNVTASAGLTISSFSASPASIQLGKSTTFTVAVSGGTSPFSYAYTGLPPGCSSSSAASLSCTPTASGTFSVKVVVTDSKQLTAQSFTNLTVTSTTGSPTISSFAASPNPVPVGQTTVLTAMVSGGTSPYVYTYTGLPPGCSSQDQNQFSCKSTSPGNYTVALIVTDKRGLSATKSLLLVVTGAISPLSVSLTSNSSSISAGSPVLLTALVSGGEGPFTYTWSLNGTNVSYGPDTSSWSDSLSHPGTFVFKVWVSDAKGKTAGSQSLSIRVTSPNSTNSRPEQFPWWIILVIAAAVAIGLILYVDHRKRSSYRAAQAQPAVAAAPAGETFANPEPEAYPEALMSPVSTTPPESFEPQSYATPGEEMVTPSAPEGVEATGEVGSPPPELSSAGEVSAPSGVADVPPSEPAPAEPEASFASLPEPEPSPVAEPYTTPEPESPVPPPDYSIMPPPAPEVESHPPPIPPPLGDEKPEVLTNCPMCGSPLTSESYCPVCQLEWVRDHGEPPSDAPEQPPPSPDEISPEAPISELPPPPENEPLSHCPQCRGPLDAEMGCATCGVVWEHRPGPSPEAPTEAPMGFVAETEPSAPVDDSAASLLSVPPPPDEHPSETSPVVAPEPEAPTLFLGKVCLVCGEPLKGDYCATCDMHWESGGPR